MQQKQFTDFGELYRAAYAERDSSRKLVLLHEVQKTIELWAQESERPAQVGASRIVPQSTASLFRSRTAA